MSIKSGNGNMIIGLCGPEGAGKSTAARLIQKRYGAKVLPFATPLKRMLGALGIADRHLYGSPEEKAHPLKELGGRSARYAMQTLGSEWGRDLMDPYFWVRAWEHTLDSEVDRGDIIVADDVRVNTESEAIEKRGGLLLCIVRSQKDFERIPRHVSEDFAALGPFNDIIVNDASEFALQRRLEIVIETARPVPRRQPV